jgi:hypothetical protein
MTKLDRHAPNGRLVAAILILAWLATPSTLHAVEPCPQALVFEGNGAASDLDLGWTGIAHDQFTNGATLTMAVSYGYSNPACAVGTLSGPLSNAAGNNERCANNTTKLCNVGDDAPCAMQCVGGSQDGVLKTCTPGITGTDPVNCPGSGAICAPAGTCRFFFGPPWPLSVGGVSVCFTNSIPGTVTGTFNMPAGVLAPSIPLEWAVQNGIGTAIPCPKCAGDPAPNDGVAGGTCSDGPRTGKACDGNGAAAITAFGTTSFDCPTNPASTIGTLSVPAVPLRSASGGQTLTLTASSPDCTGRFICVGGANNGTGCFSSTQCAGGGTCTPKKCFCDTCDNAAATACSSNADCAAAGATVCGGKRCLGGSNGGAPCTAPSACSGGGFCGRPGEATEPDGCIDGCTATANGEGECQNGPVDSNCAPPEQYLGCSGSADCPITGTCNTVFRACYPDNGVLNGSVSVVGAPSPPINNTATPTLGALFCLRPMAPAAANTVAGLPGLGRLTLPGTLRLAQEFASRVIAPGGTVTTGANTTGMDPIETSVTSPNGGAISITEQNTVGTAPAGFTFVNQQVDITAPAASDANPLVITFTIDSSRIPPSPPGIPNNCGEKKNAIVIKKNNVRFENCTDSTLPAHTSSPNVSPCIANRTCVGGDAAQDSTVRLTVWTTSASLWTFLVPETPAATPVGGKKLQLKDDPTPTKRKLLLQLVDTSLTSPLAGSVGDPTCAGVAGGGARLAVFGTSGTPQFFSTSLPCARWQPIGDPADAKGYKYTDSKQTNGPCKSVLLKNAQGVKPGQLKAVCSGKNPAQPLDYDLVIAEGSVGVTFQTGTAPGFCAEFGGTVKDDGVKAFSAQDAPAPGVCPTQ